MIIVGIVFISTFCWDYGRLRGRVVGNSASPIYHNPSLIYIRSSEAYFPCRTLYEIQHLMHNTTIKFQIFICKSNLRYIISKKIMKYKLEAYVRSFIVINCNLVQLNFLKQTENYLNHRITFTLLVKLKYYSYYTFFSRIKSWFFY